MRRRLVVFIVGLLMLAMPSRAGAEPSRSAGARTRIEDLRREGRYGFCGTPKRSLDPRQRALCPLAPDVRGCEDLVAACNRDGTEKKPSEDAWSGLLRALATVAQLLVWLLLALVLVAIAVPLLRVLLRARRDKQLADQVTTRNVATLAITPASPEPETITDAEVALHEAEAHARRGELAHALRLYLSASLLALERRGAVRLARHQTNGEYVRSCAEADARQPLREIVREVDRVEFGKLAPTTDGVAEVASRATALVRRPQQPGRASALVTGVTGLLLLLGLTGCGDQRRLRGVDDPAGDELPIELLRSSGYKVSPLGRSLATMPMPEPAAAVPVVLVDVTRVPLEDETEAHLLRWVEAGGVLVLLGPPSVWPSKLAATEAVASTRALTLGSGDVDASGALVAVPRSLTWPGSEPVAWLGKSVYAAHVSTGAGAIVGIAGEELFTNVGVARPDNAAALLALIDVAAADSTEADVRRGLADDSATPPEVRVARAEDGIQGPSNPFAALVQAGLGKAAWHALAACVVLFLAFGLRHARARPTPPAARRAFAEHVEATGAFYGRARALGHALASYGRFAEMRLRERVPRGGDPAAFLATRAKVDPERAARVWKRAIEARADDPPRGDELATIRDLRAMLTKALEPG